MRQPPSIPRQICQSEQPQTKNWRLQQMLIKLTRLSFRARPPLMVESADFCVVRVRSLITEGAIFHQTIGEYKESVGMTALVERLSHLDCNFIHGDRHINLTALTCALWPSLPGHSGHMGSRSHYQCCLDGEADSEKDHLKMHWRRISSARPTDRAAK